MIHGRNAAPKNILDLVGVLDQPGVAYLAPAAAGGAWYPLSFLAPIEQNEPGISSGIAVIRALIDQVIESGIPAAKILLLGFSQGACLACTAAHRRPMRYGGVIVYSGGLIGPPGTTWPEAGDFDRTPVFFGCSDKDAHVPEIRVNESAAVLERMNAEVTKRIYPGMGHSINHDEIKFTKDLLASLA
jgi:phospholipase/carboxylesterase